MVLITLTTTPQPSPIESFRELGDKYCIGSPGFRHEEATYSNFLKAIYGSSEQRALDLEESIQSARSSAVPGEYGAPTQLMQSVLGLLGQFSSKLAEVEVIPVLVFAYCKEAASVYAATMNGNPYPGHTGYLLRLSLLEKLSSLKIPDFCLERLRAAAKLSDSKEEGYVEQIALGARIDISHYLANVLPQSTSFENRDPSPLSIVEAERAAIKDNFSTTLECARYAQILPEDTLNALNAAADIGEAASSLNEQIEAARESRSEQYQHFQRLLRRMSVA